VFPALVLLVAALLVVGLLVVVGTVEVVGFDVLDVFDVFAVLGVAVELVTGVLVVVLLTGFGWVFADAACSVKIALHLLLMFVLQTSHYLVPRLNKGLSFGHFMQLCAFGVEYGNY